MLGGRDSCFWVRFGFLSAVRPLLGAGGFPSWSHPQLQQGAGWRVWFHLRLEVCDTVRGEVCGESLCAAPWGHRTTRSQQPWGAALGILGVQVQRLRPKRGTDSESHREERRSRAWNWAWVLQSQAHGDIRDGKEWSK